MEYETLGKVAEIIMGQSPPGEMTNTDGYGLPLLNGPTEFGAHHPLPVQYTTEARKVASPGDLLFCVRGSTTGRMNWADRKYAIGRGIAAIRHRSSYELQPLVRAVIEYQLPELLNRATGSTFPNVSVSQLAELLYPTLDEAQQREIAHILGTLDDKIELNRRMNATLEAIARAIFKSWFVDFDPVHAKARGEQPYGMDAETAALFPDSFENSELGPIPEGWGIARLPEVFDVNPPRTLKKGQLAPYLEMKNMPEFSARPTTWEVRSFGSGMRFINGDVLVARITPCLENGKTAFVDFLDEGQVGWGSTEYIVLHSKEGLPSEYSYFLARSDEFRTFAIQSMTGTSGRQRVPASALEHFLLPVPPPQIAQKFGNIARLLLRAIKANDEESRTLAELRDALLPKLISGEIRVGDIESEFTA